MNTKKRNTIFITIVIIFIIIIIGIVGLKALKKQEHQKSADSTKSTLEIQQLTEEVLKKAEAETERTDALQLSIGEYSFQIISANVLQTLSYENLRDLNEMNMENTNNDNTLPQGFSYLTIRLQLSNNSEQNKELGLNSNHVIIYQGEELKTTLDLYMYDSNQDLPDNTQYFHYTIDAQKTWEMELVYIIPDEYLVAGNDIFLQLNPLGQAGTIVYGRTTDGERIAISPTENIKMVSLNHLLELK